MHIHYTAGQVQFHSLTPSQPPRIEERAPPSLCFLPHCSFEWCLLACLQCCGLPFCLSCDPVYNLDTRAGAEGPLNNTVLDYKENEFYTWVAFKERITSSHRKGITETWQRPTRNISYCWKKLRLGDVMNSDSKKMEEQANPILPNSPSLSVSLGVSNSDARFSSFAFTPWRSQILTCGFTDIYESLPLPKLTPPHFLLPNQLGMDLHSNRYL